ncbi:hypothetical protein F2Q68_00005048 [Brassica cretica]|uniref:glutamate decarboxylase n=1 Tax=Brassica cretica TaxID=69181 RepID=A0A8S9JCV4_BRACR|nr:hypothetical protein F2Q68_00005048 [Brassica cretica]
MVLSRTATESNEPVSSTFGSRYALTALPKYEIGESSIPKDAAYQVIKDELMLDGNPRLNLASFETTWMEPECDKLIMDSINKNYVDMDEYPVTTELQTTPGETTLSEMTPGETTPSEPPPAAVSSGPPSDGSMNYVVELSDTALKETISKLKQSDRLVRARNTVLNRKTSEFRAAIDKAATEQSRLLAGKKAQKEKFMEKFGELKDKEIMRPKGRTKRPGESSGSRLFRDTRSLTGSKGPRMRLLHLLGPAPSMANLVVSEESLIPILGVSDANPTTPLGLKEAGSEPVDQLELSYSSAEEEGGEKSDERVPGDNPQGTEEGLVDEVENPPASATDEAGGASDQLKARAFVDVISELFTLRLFFVSDLHKTTPGETTLSETTPGETTPSEPPPTAVSSGPPVGPINIESSREDLMQSSERETAEPSVTDALKETISKLKQSDRLVRARSTVLNRKTSEFRAVIDKAATEQSRLLAGKKAQKEKFMEKLGELRDKFKNAAIDPYRSNVGLIDAGTAASLQTPTSSQGDHATERSNETTGRELG